VGSTFIEQTIVGEVACCKTPQKQQKEKGEQGRKKGEPTIVIVVSI
jgi:hypothetical protein